MAISNKKKDTKTDRKNHRPAINAENKTQKLKVQSNHKRKANNTKKCQMKTISLKVGDKRGGAAEWVKGRAGGGV